MKKIVKKDFNVHGWDSLAILKSYLQLSRLPVLDIAEGPKIKYLIALFCLHTFGRLGVIMQLKYPKLYYYYARIKNSLMFRYNHRKNQRNLAKQRKREAA